MSHNVPRVTNVLLYPCIHAEEQRGIARGMQRRASALFNMKQRALPINKRVMLNVNKDVALFMLFLIFFPAQSL